MLFSFLPWEFMKHFSKKLEEKSGLFTLLCPDVFLSRMIYDHVSSYIKKNKKQQEISIRVMLGHEITVDWIEKNLFELSLFGSSEAFFIHNSEDFSPKVKEFLLKRSSDFSMPYIFLSFSKEDSFLKKLIKQDDGVHFEMVEPRFWEAGKLLDFFCQHLQLKISNEGKDFLMQSLENTSYEFFNALHLLKLVYPERDLFGLEQVQALIVPSRMDHFAFSSWYADKKMDKFFDEVLKRGMDFDALRGLFAFMQGHLLKICDTHPIQKKGKTNRYEQEILKKSKQWTQNELKKALRLFGNLEILAKQKSPFLIDQLRSLRIGSLN